MGQRGYLAMRDIKIAWTVAHNSEQSRCSASAMSVRFEHGAPRLALNRGMHIDSARRPGECSLTVVFLSIHLQLIDLMSVFVVSVTRRGSLQMWSEDSGHEHDEAFHTSH